MGWLLNLVGAFFAVLTLGVLAWIFAGEAINKIFVQLGRKVVQRKHQVRNAWVSGGPRCRKCRRDCCIWYSGDAFGWLLIGDVILCIISWVVAAVCGMTGALREPSATPVFLTISTVWLITWTWIGTMKCAKDQLNRPMALLAYNIFNGILTLVPCFLDIDNWLNTCYDTTNWTTEIQDHKLIYCEHHHVPNTQWAWHNPGNCVTLTVDFFVVFWALSCWFVNSQRGKYQNSY